MRAVKLGRREYVNDFQQAVDPRGRDYYWIAGDRVDNLDEDDTDVAQHHHGAITLTPLHMHLTDTEMLQRLSSFSLPTILP